MSPSAAPATAMVPSTGQQAPTLTTFEVIERVITSGDLQAMSAPDRVAFYWRTCESLGLNPLTRPFEFIQLNGKLTMYARKDATDQLRKINGVSVTNIARAKDDELGLITVTATGRDKSGREDQATGVVTIKGLGGEALANAVMKAETKAKRRLTLSLVGLGFLDESEVEGATRDVDPTTGEVLERAKPQSLLDSVKAQQEAMAAAPTEDDQTVEGDAVEVAPGQTSFLDEAPADAVEEPETPPAPMDYAELKARIKADKVDLTVAERIFHETFPDVTEIGSLTDAQRGIYWAALEAANG